MPSHVNDEYIQRGANIIILYLISPLSLRHSASGGSITAAAFYYSTGQKAPITFIQYKHVFISSKYFMYFIPLKDKAGEIYVCVSVCVCVSVFFIFKKAK